MAVSAVAPLSMRPAQTSLEVTRLWPKRVRDLGPHGRPQRRAAEVVDGVGVEVGAADDEEGLRRSWEAARRAVPLREVGLGDERPKTTQASATARWRSAGVAPRARSRSAAPRAGAHPRHGGLDPAEDPPSRAAGCWTVARRSSERGRIGVAAAAAGREAALGEQVGGRLGAGREVALRDGREVGEAGPHQRLVAGEGGEGGGVAAVVAPGPGQQLEEADVGGVPALSLDEVGALRGRTWASSALGRAGLRASRTPRASSRRPVNSRCSARERSAAAWAKPSSVSVTTRSRRARCSGAPTRPLRGS